MTTLENKDSYLYFYVIMIITIIIVINVYNVFNVWYNVYSKIKSNSKLKIKAKAKGGGVNGSIERSQTSKKWIYERMAEEKQRQGKEVPKGLLGKTSK